MSAITLAIANARGVPGTAGAVVRDAKGVRYLLASHHVVFGDGAVPGDRVWALPPEDALEAHELLVGRAVRGQIGRVTYVDEPCFVDAALVSIDDPPAWVMTTIARLPQGAAAPPVRGASVAKHGATTGVTRGVVLDVAYSDEPTILGRTWTATKQILVGSEDPALVFSGPGDSGAALLDTRGLVAGLVWGSNASGHGIACPIRALLDALAVTMPEPRA